VNPYALLHKGSSIHLPCQFERCKNDPGGLQRVQTLDGYIKPLSIQDGLLRLNKRLYTDQEFKTLPHAVLTPELEWDPSVLDHSFKKDEQWGESPTFKSQLMKSAITRNAFYCTITPTSNARMVLPRMISSTNVFTLLTCTPPLQNMRAPSLLCISKRDSRSTKHHRKLFFLKQQSNVLQTSNSYAPFLDGIQKTI
jgi:hypothetical protein